jgi:hypothetical protein
VFRFRRTAATLTGIGVLVALSVLSAIPASAKGSDIQISDAYAYQYYRYCDYSQTPPQCNLQGSTELYFDVWNADNGPAQTVPYTILNGTAVDYTGFDIPMTGYINVPADGGTGALIVPVLNAGNEPGATGTFTVVVGGGATATGTIRPNAELPADCSLSVPTGYPTAIAATCTDQPTAETWYIWAWVLSWDGYQIERSLPVTGNGTATIYSSPYPPMNGEVTFAS